MHARRALLAALVLASVGCAALPVAPRRAAAVDRRVRFALDRAAAARLNPAARAFARAVLEALCRHDLDAVMASLDPRRRDAQLASEGGDRDSFLGLQLILQPLHHTEGIPVVTPWTDRPPPGAYGALLRNVERAVVVGVTPWDGTVDGLSLRGVLDLRGGQHCGFSLAIFPRGGRYFVDVAAG